MELFILQNLNLQRGKECLEGKERLERGKDCLEGKRMSGEGKRMSGEEVVIVE